MTDNPKAKQRFTEMKTAMLLHTPFFASLLLDSMDPKVGPYPEIPTAGTDGKRILFNEDYLAGLTLPEAVFVCCHEVAHGFLLHMDRFKTYEDLGFDGQPFNFGVGNVAADFIINDMLVKAKTGTMPKGLLHAPDKYTSEMQFEEVYRDLMKQAKKGGKSGGSGSGSGSGQSKDENGNTISNDGFNGMKPMDSHIFAPSRMSEAEMKRSIASARAQAKAMGKMPAELDRWVENMLAPQVDWRERLRMLIQRIVGRDSTSWAAPHRRRLVSQKIYLPSYTGFGAGTIVWITDTSGSMGQAEYDASFAEVAEIITVCRPEALYMMSCDAKVHDVHLLDSYADVYAEKPVMRGGGGTSFIPPFEKVAEMGLEPALLIYFTDGYGSFPKQAPNYPVLWVSTTETRYPWGDVVQVKL